MGNDPLSVRLAERGPDWIAGASDAVLGRVDYHDLRWLNFVLKTIAARIYSALAGARRGASFAFPVSAPPLRDRFSICVSRYMGKGGRVVSGKLDQLRKISSRSVFGKSIQAIIGPGSVFSVSAGGASLCKDFFNASTGLAISVLAAEGFSATGAGSLAAKARLA